MDGDGESEGPGVLVFLLVRCPSVAPEDVALELVRGDVDGGVVGCLAHLEFVEDGVFGDVTVDDSVEKQVGEVQSLVALGLEIFAGTSSRFLLSPVLMSAPDLKLEVFERLVVRLNGGVERALKDDRHSSSLSLLRSSACD